MQAHGGYIHLRKLPREQVCFASTPNNDSLPNPNSEPEIWFVDLHDYWEQTDADGHIYNDDLDDIHVVDERTRWVGTDPRLRPVFLGWEFDDVDRWVTSTIADLSEVPGRMQVTDDGLSHSYVPGTSGYLTPRVDEESTVTFQFRREVHARLDQLATLATDLLPDFLDGSIQANIELPTDWGESPHVRVTYSERTRGEEHSLRDYGRGASRWLTIAVQVALQIMEGDWVTSTLPVPVENAFSGWVLLVDEPEAHLHPSAVASVVRWCRRMVDRGFQVLVASHHEEFLRASGDDVTFVRVSRASEAWFDVEGERHESMLTRARTLSTSATPVLQELADEVGMHPAAALSLHRAILFVEGSLDIAVLDEYAGAQLDAAGVTLIPIHGTKNLEGLIDGEFTVRLGMKTAILTDNTVTATLADRSKNKRKGEEKKVIKLLERFEEQNLRPPDWFGVPEEDLLFALPADGIRSCYSDTASEFPGWLELREECRTASGASKSDSVDWKRYANDHYGLPLTSPEGVRSVVRKLDLADIPLPSVRTVVDQILAWAAKPPTSPG